VKLVTLSDCGLIWVTGLEIGFNLKDIWEFAGNALMILLLLAEVILMVLVAELTKQFIKAPNLEDPEPYVTSQLIVLGTVMISG
jgi:hypothetical protein